MIALDNKTFGKSLKNLNIVLEDKPTCAVAVSGGADSTALVFLLSNYLKNKNGSVIALIVDHMLRDDSYLEAKWVQDNLSKYNIKSKILTWDWKKQNNLSHKISNSSYYKYITSVQEQARNNRYKLLENYCKQNNILHLFVGHHLNDNQETIYMQQARNINSTSQGISPHTIFKVL